MMESTSARAGRRMRISKSVKAQSGVRQMVTVPEEDKPMTWNSAANDG